MNKSPCSGPRLSGPGRGWPSGHAAGKRPLRRLRGRTVQARVRARAWQAAAPPAEVACLKFKFQVTISVLDTHRHESVEASDSLNIMMIMISPPPAGPGPRLRRRQSRPSHGARWVVRPCSELVTCVEP